MSERATNDNAATLGAGTAIRLVAGRELSTRLRSKAFRVMTVIVLVAIVLLTIVFKLLSGSAPSVTHIGLLDANPTVTGQLESAATATGQHIATVPMASERAGRDAVHAGEIAALILPSHGGDLNVVVESGLPKSLSDTLWVFARNLAVDNQIRSLGGDPVAVQGALDSVQVHTDVLSPPHPYDVGSLVLGFAAGILIYLSLMVTGQMVAQGVVEEKSSRVVELLLATIRPWELMAGKVVGIGLLGLIQFALFVIVGVGLSAGLGLLSLSIGAAIGTIIWLVVWYLVGFTLYAFAFAGAGALVSRQEDAAGVTMPVLMLLIIGYVLGVSILPGDPSSGLIEVLSMIPVFAPTLMPIRLAMGGVPAWEAALSLVLALATIPALAALAGRIYRNAVIHTGARVPLRKALAG